MQSLNLLDTEPSEFEHGNSPPFNAWILKWWGCISTIYTSTYTSPLIIKKMFTVEEWRLLGYYAVWLL
jgi:hypothetical protein